MAATVWVFTAAAADRDDRAAPDRLETIVVTGNYSPTAAVNTTAVMATLDQSQLSRLDKRRLGDALRTLPGVLLEEQGGDGGLTALSIRGGEANFTQVLLDGVPLNDPGNTRGGSYDINLLNSAALARIEVVRGPQSAVYGSDALAGVVNLISPRPGSLPAPVLRIGVGEYGYRDYHLMADTELGDLGLALELGRRESGEQVTGSRRDTDMAALRGEWALNDAHSVSAQLRLIDGERSSYPEQSGGPLFARSDALDYSEYRTELYALAWDADLRDSWHSRLQASRLRHDEDTRSPGIPPFSAVPPNGSDTAFTRNQVSWVNTVQLAAAHRLNIGADYRDETGVSAGYLDIGMRVPTDYRMSRETLGSFVELQSRVVEPLLLQASLRSDDPDGFARQTTARVGLRYAVRPDLTVRANWGEGFKLPSFFALGHALVGNPELQPETAKGADLGLEWQPLETLSLSVTGFFNRYRNLVDFDPEAFTNVNRREVETQGGEGELRWQPLPAVNVQAQLTYTDIDVIGEDRTLLGRSAWKAGVWADWQFRPDWHTGLDYQWTGKVPAASLHTGQTTVTELDDHARLDWRLGWQASSTLRLELAVDNLFDETYQISVGFPAPGRTLRVAAIIELGR